MGCGASSGNPPLSDTKMRLISEMPPQKRRDCEDTFSALDKDGNGPCSKPPPHRAAAAALTRRLPTGCISLEDSIWAKPFLDAHDMDGDGEVTMVRSRLRPGPNTAARRACVLRR